MIETHVVYIREGIDAIRDRLDKQNATLLNHERRLTRLSTTQDCYWPAVRIGCDGGYSVWLTSMVGELTLRLT